MARQEFQEFEELLLKEKKEIEETLSAGGWRDPKNPDNWEASYPDLNVSASDKNDMADEVEEFDNALGINAVLEGRLQDISAALRKISAGSYGICEKGGEKIDEKRLQANPAARTCVKHS